jgi:hypothetical protein
VVYYRGWSILSAMSKLFKKMVCDNSLRLSSHIWLSTWFCEGGFWQGAHTLLKFNFSILFGGSLLCWMGSYLTRRTQLVELEDYLSESIQYHSGVPQGIHLGTILFINGALDLFENMSVLRYADDLKNFMTIKCIRDCQLLSSRPFGGGVPQQ